MRLTIIALAVLVLIFGGSRSWNQLAFVNGQIHTMNADNQIVEAMLVKNGRITAIGSSAVIAAASDRRTQVINLQGRTVLPGFIDAHSHFPSSGIRAVSVDLSPPPIGVTGSVEELLARIEQAAKEQDNQDWILGYNYDNTALKDGKHPTREQLDSVVSDQPVYLWHSSGHMGVANSKALNEFSITETSTPPFGGHYEIDPLTGRLTGLLQEKGAPPLSNLIGQYSYAQQLKIITSARDEYLAAGMTTVQNGFAGNAQMVLLRMARWVGLIDQRVIVWPAHSKGVVDFTPVQMKRNDFTFAKGAVKLQVDGSPQGMTAFLSEPYFKPLNNDAEYRGFALINQKRLTELVTKYHREGHQLALHGNGDAAMEYIIVAVEAAQSAYPRDDARHILVHAQTIRKDQIERLNALSITPTFFNSHTYYWGDWHRTRSLGPERAKNISPTKWAQDEGVRFTLHTDAPVTPISPMQLVWSATKRETQSGFELGVEQRIDTLSALRALTIDAAWQNHLETQVGSLEVGKLADAVVLSDSPYEVDDVRTIEVLATYIGGVKRFGALSTKKLTTQ